MKKFKTGDIICDQFPLSFPLEEYLYLLLNKKEGKFLHLQKKKVFYYHTYHSCLTLEEYLKKQEKNTCE